MLIIKDKAGDYSASNIGRLLPLTSDRTGLFGEYLFGRNAATTFVNSGSGGVPLLYGAAPIYGVHRISVDGSHAVDTGHVQQSGDDLTVMLFVSFPGGWPTDATDSRHSLLGDQLGGSQIAFTTIASGDGAAVVMQTTANEASALLDNSSAESGFKLSGNPADFRALSASISGQTNPTITVREFRGGVQTWSRSEQFSGKSRKYDGLMSLLIGSVRQPYPAGLVSNRFECAAGLLWRRALTSDACAAAYLEVRKVLSGMNINA